MFQILKKIQTGFRDTPGTVLRNESTGEDIYVPPQTIDQIQHHMAALETFINNDDLCTLDPLIKMAIIHHQFESIHPFYDGNGRIGRILNILYLVRTGLLDSPILYHSREINRTKHDYYTLLQEVRDHNEWEKWILYVLTIVKNTALETKNLIAGMRQLMTSYKAKMRDDFPRMYSQDLLNNLFLHPYTRVKFIERDLNVSTPTATRYLKSLAEAGFVMEVKKGRKKYYVNHQLVKLFVEVSS